MSENLAAIKLLSDKWEAAFETEGFTEFQGDRFPRQEYHEKGEKILGMYEEEYAKSPQDADTAIALTHHLFRLANARYAQIHFPWLRDGHGAAAATKACAYAFRCCTMFPDCGAASILAIIYKEVGFYGTALFWCKKMERAAELKGLQDRAVEAKAMIIEMEADGKTLDPVIKSDAVFPKKDTPGLVLEYQPQDPSPAPKNSLQQDAGKQIRSKKAPHGNRQMSYVRTALPFCAILVLMILPFLPSNHRVGLGHKLSPTVIAPAESSSPVHNAKLTPIATLSDSGGTGFVQFSPDGKSLCTTYGGDTLKLCDSSTGQIVRTVTLPGSSAFSGLRFSPDSKTLIVCIDSHIIEVWDVPSLERKGRRVAYSEGDAMYPPGFSLSPDGQFVSLNSPSGHPIIYDVSAGEKIKVVDRLDIIPEQVGFGPSGTKLLVAAGCTPDGEGLPARIWDFGSDRMVRSLSNLDGVGDAYDFRISNDGKRLALDDGNSGTLIYDVVTGERVGAVVAEWDGNGVWFSPNGEWLIKQNESEAQAGAEVCLYSIEEKGRITNLKFPKKIAEIAFSPDLSECATVDQGSGMTKLWRLD